MADNGSEVLSPLPKLTKIQHSENPFLKVEVGEVVAVVLLRQEAVATPRMHKSERENGILPISVSMLSLTITRKDVLAWSILKGERNDSIPM